MQQSDNRQGNLFKIKEVLIDFFTSFFSLLPEKTVVRTIRRVPKLARCAPETIHGVFGGYLDEFRVEIDSRYPIERKMLSGTYEPETLRIIEKFVKPGDCCLDIGANVGAITLALAKAAGPSGTVTSFEPGPVTFSRLERNIELNPACRGNVHVVNCGLSDRDGELFWKEDNDNPGNASLLGDTGTRVEVLTLDEYAKRQELDALDFIKIDVEGMEFEVIRGGIETIGRFKPAIYFETLYEFRKVRGFDPYRKIEELLATLGYRLYKVDSFGRTALTTSTDLSANTLALPS